MSEMLERKNKPRLEVMMDRDLWKLNLELLLLQSS